MSYAGQCFWTETKKPWRFAHFWQGTESLALATQKRHLNLQKWSDHVVFFNIFWLGNLLRSSTACTFSTSQLPKVLRTWCAFAHFDFVNVLHATTACTFSTSQLPKVLRGWGAFSILTWKCASRHDGVHFLNISTFKNSPALACFVHFNLEMCFAPRRRAIFHLSSPQMAPHLPL